MTPELEKFVVLATRPLDGRPELRDEAQTELMARLSQGGVPPERMDLRGPTARLERARSGERKWGRGLLLGALLAVMAGFLVGLWRDASMLARVIYSDNLSMRERGAQLSRLQEWLEPGFYDWLDRKAPELPLSGRGGEVERQLQRDPEDLAMLQEALLRRPISEPRLMTGEERAMIERLDPGNAYWPLLEMDWEFRKATENVASIGGVFRRVSPDPTAWERARQCFAEAAACDHWRSYGPDLARRQIEAYGPDQTVCDGMILAELARLGRWRHWVFWQARGEWDGLARMVLESPDNELFGLYTDWKALLLLGLESEHPDAASLMRMQAKVASVSGGFSQRFRQLGMREEADEAWRIRGDLMRLVHGGGHRLWEEGLRLSNMRFPGPVVPFRPSELRPGCRADLAWVQRLLLWPLVLVGLGFLLLWGVEAWRRPAEVKGMARGLMPLLTWRDHLVIGLVGILIPWACWWGITRLTPLGFDERILDGDDFKKKFLVLQMAIGMVLGLVTLTQAVSWRWARVGGFLGVGGSAPWLGWAVVGVVAVCLGAVGAVRFLDPGHRDLGLLGCAAAAALGLLWLLWGGIVHLCTPHRGALGPNLVARTMVPWALAGVATLLLAAGVLRFAEGWWYAKDPLLPSWTSEHYRNALEERWVHEMAGRLRQVIRGE